MKRYLIVLGITIILVCVTLSVLKAKDSNEDGIDLSKGFTVSSETLIDNNWFRVDRLLIKGKGPREVSLRKNAGGLGMAVIRTPDNTFTAEVLLTAMMSPASHLFTWFATVYKLENGKRVSGGSGSPRTFVVKKEEKSTSNLAVRQIVKLNNISGYHGYGEPVSLGHFLTELREMSASRNELRYTNVPDLVLVVK